MENLDSASGRDLLRIFHAAARWLGKHSARVDAINVFPVADGDTGTNMLRTLEAALGAAAALDGGSVTAAAASAALSRGALAGARGNSGVILSQFFRGMAATLDGRETCAGEDLAPWFGRAEEFARGGIAQPVEGTMLTVLTDSAKALRDAGGRQPRTFASALDIAVRAARESVARTPSLLPVLRENGVVDAGAEGFLRILEGAARASAGVANPALSGTLDTVPGEPDAASPPLSAATGSGLFCTSLFLEGSDLPLARIRERLASEGTSLIVAGDSRCLRIHIHTARPDEVVAWARSLGAVSKVDRHELPPAGAAGRGTVAAATRPALLAIAPGEGIGDVFEGLGASPLVPRAASGLPTVAELREVLALLPGSGVILLPNSPAGLEIARKAVVSFGKPVTIIPTRTVPEGTAAIVSFRYDLPMKENALLMERAARSVRTIELSEARGRVEARLDGISTGACDDPRKAVTEALQRLGMTNPETVTVYTGASVAPSLVESVCGVLRRAMPEAALETVPGGQAQPGLIIGVE